MSKILFLLVLVFVAVNISVPVFAAECGGVETNIVDCDSSGGGSIRQVLIDVVNITSIGIGVLGVIGISVVGIKYLTAGGSEEQTRKAKRRIIEIIIGLAAYAAIWLAVNWLLPGGLFFNNIEAESISFTTQSVSLTTGDSVTLRASMNPIDASNTITYSSSDSSVVTIDSSGRVVAKSPGTAEITAKTSNGKTATASVTVSKPPSNDIPASGHPDVSPDSSDSSGSSGSSGSSSSSGSSGSASTGSFDGDLKAIESSRGVKVGVAASAPGNKNVSNVKVGGSWLGGRAWSTIKVPLSIAAIQRNANTGRVTDPYGGSCSYSLSSAVSDAITRSNNCAAWWLWKALGGDNSQAAENVTSVIRSGGDLVTRVISNGDGKSLTSGKTIWSLNGQAIFMSNISTINGASSVMSNMIIHNASDSGHGLNKFSAISKGGWGNVITRQLGIIKLNNGRCSAVAIGTDAGSNFSILDEIAYVLRNYQDDLPSGSCPQGL